MVDAKRKPTANGPHSVYVLREEYQKSYINNTLDRFLEKYVYGDDKTTASGDSENTASDDETTTIDGDISCDQLHSFN